MSKATVGDQTAPPPARGVISDNCGNSIPVHAGVSGQDDIADVRDVDGARVLLEQVAERHRLDFVPDNDFNEVSGALTFLRIWLRYHDLAVMQPD